MNKFILGVLVFFCISCQQQPQEKTSGATYFDIENYFTKEINRLTALNPTVLKEVIVADKTERKSIKIADWKTELAMFFNSAINKESWRDEFKVDTKNNSTTYTTTNLKIPIKKIEILKKGEKVSGIKIYRLSDNYLYRSTDSLIYYPDSLYQIKSYQKIKLLAPKNYQVTGKLSK